MDANCSTGHVNGEKDTDRIHSDILENEAKASTNTLSAGDTQPEQKIFSLYYEFSLLNIAGSKRTYSEAPPDSFKRMKTSNLSHNFQYPPGKSEEEKARLRNKLDRIQTKETVLRQESSTQIWYGMDVLERIFVQSVANFQHDLNAASERVHRGSASNAFTAFSGMKPTVKSSEKSLQRFALLKSSILLERKKFDQEVSDMLRNKSERAKAETEAVAAIRRLINLVNQQESEVRKPLTRRTPLSFQQATDANRDAETFAEYFETLSEMERDDYIMQFADILGSRGAFDSFLRSFASFKTKVDQVLGIDLE